MRSSITPFATVLVLSWASSLPVAAQRSQVIEFTGTVRSDAGDPLPGAGVAVQGTFIACPTNEAGGFKFRVPANLLPVAVRVTFVGYETVVDTLRADGRPLNVMLRPSLTLMGEVVVAASRHEELGVRAGVTIDKVTAEQVARLPSPDLLTGLARQKGVDVTTSGMFMASLSTRGFNAPNSERLVQLVDYVDTQAPSLNVNGGNSTGLPEVDIASVEILHGPSSALYGANAFNGVVVSNSKDPFQYPGLSVRLRGGNRDYTDAQLRYAQKIGQKFALKFTGSFARGLEWVGTNEDAQSRLYAPGNNPQGSPLGYDAVNRYGDVGTTFGATGGALNGKTVFMPGWSEREIIEGDEHAKLYRLIPSLHYLITDKVKAMVEVRRSEGTTAYQATSRYRLKNYGTNQYLAEIKGANWFVRAFQTQDFGNNTYDLPFTGAFMQTSIDPNSGAANLSYAQEYFGAYARAYNVAFATNGGNADAAGRAAQAAAAPYQLTSGTPAFEQLRQRIISDPTPGRGARVNPMSRLRDLSGQYNHHFQQANLDAMVGGAYRRYRLVSDGQLFADTPGSGGIRNEDFSAYLQLSKALLNDRLKVTAAGRADGFQNFDAVYSPRLSAVYSLGAQKQHNFRANYNQAYRSPTQQGQYLQLDLGRVLLLGNVGNGYQGYSQDLTSASLRTALTSPNPAEALRASEVNLGRLKPERVTTFEIGYKGELTKNLVVDMNIYRSRFRDFIGQVRFIGNTDGSRPTITQLAAAASSPTPFQQGATRIIQVQANTAQEVSASGGLVAVTYTFSKTLGLTGNYALNVLETKNLPDIFQSYYNTPQNKFNLGAFGTLKALSYSVNYRWAQSHLFETVFASGQLAATSSLESQVSYALPKLHAAVQLGGSNLLNTNNIQVYGGPQIGRLVYVGLTVDMP